MNVYCFDEISEPYGAGLMIVAANSEEEAINIATNAGYIDSWYGFLPKCHIVPELTANVDTPKLIKQFLYAE